SEPLLSWRGIGLDVPLKAEPASVPVQERGHTPFWRYRLAPRCCLCRLTQGVGSHRCAIPIRGLGPITRSRCRTPTPVWGAKTVRDSAASRHPKIVAKLLIYVRISTSRGLLFVR